MRMLKALKELLRPKSSQSLEEQSGMNYLVAGLGNIGAEYASTRHNSGFMVLDAWAQASNVSFKTERYGDVAEVSFKGRKFFLLKPSTYMNLSGNAVRYWVGKLKLPMENLIVVCDESTSRSVQSVSARAEVMAVTTVSRTLRPAWAPHHGPGYESE